MVVRGAYTVGRFLNAWLDVCVSGGKSCFFGFFPIDKYV